MLDTDSLIDEDRLERLSHLFDRPEMARATNAIVRALEQGHSGRVSIADPTDYERRAVDELLGRPPSRGKRLSIPLQPLGDVLVRAGLASGLEAAIAALRGPLRDRPSERDRESSAWTRVFKQQGPVAQAMGLAQWLQGIEADGLLKRLSGRDPALGESLVARALDVIQCLPEKGIALSTLAAQRLGDAHGLDPGRPVASLVRRALIHLQGAGVQAGMGDDALWASFGVLVGGGITSTALVLNLPVDGDGPLATVLQAAASVGEPMHLTLRQLLRDPLPGLAPGGILSVCENPAIVAEAANRLGPDCGPLICTQGQPSIAVSTLLGQQRVAGTIIRYHGDFDWPGIRIANGLVARHGCVPWRMGAVDYRAASSSGKGLTGDVVDAIWDPELADVMRKRGEVIEEERLVGILLEDLGGAGAERCAGPHRFTMGCGETES